MFAALPVAGPNPRERLRHDFDDLAFLVLSASPSVVLLLIGVSMGSWPLMAAALLLAVAPYLVSQARDS